MESSGQPWTDAEVAIVQAVFADPEVEDVWRAAQERLPHRTVKGIRHIVSLRGIGGGRPAPRAFAYWSKPDIEKLKSAFAATDANLSTMERCRKIAHLFPRRTPHALLRRLQDIEATRYAERKRAETDSRKKINAMRAKIVRGGKLDSAGLLDMIGCVI